MFAAGFGIVARIVNFRPVILFSVLVALAGCQKSEQTVALAPEAALETGWDNYRLSEFDRAAIFFEQAVVGSVTNSELQLQARYALATTWNLRRPGEDRAKAEAMFRDILAASPSRDLTAWTSLALARMRHLVPVDQEPDMNAVRAAYQEIIANFSGHLAAKEAFIYKMSTFIATLEPKQTGYAIACLSRYVGQPGQKEFLQPAWSLMAVGYTTLKMPQQRLIAEIRALQCTEIDPSNPFNEFAWAYWNIATIAEFDVGDFSLARFYYLRLLREYPNDIKVFGAKEALARMDALKAKIRSEFPPSPKSEIRNPKRIRKSKSGGARA